MSAKSPDKYPPYPGSGYDYAIIHSAKSELRDPNRSICIYCRQQGLDEAAIEHLEDCPHLAALFEQVKKRDERMYKKCLRGICSPQEALDVLDGRAPPYREFPPRP